MKLLLSTVALLACAAARGQEPPIDWNFRLAALESRVTALEARFGDAPPVIRETPRAAYGQLRSFPPGYAEAFHRALAENKPLVVWQGTAVCPPCVHDTEGEWVNYVGPVPDYPADAVVVDVPEGGGMMRVGTITDWTTGDAVRGHVPSIRRALRNWRERRTATMQASAAQYQTAQYQQGGPPVVSYGMMAAPMMAPMAVPMMAGGCASCGAAGRGLFGRR